MMNYIKNNISESVDAKKRLLENDKLLAVIEKVAGECIEAYKRGNKILVCGNGGSASDAQHMVGELVGRYKLERFGIPAVALNSNVAVMTAIGNDYDYDSIYSKQVKAMGNPGDIFFGISTSGNSANVVEAACMAEKLGIKTVSLTGEGGGRLGQISDYAINVPSANTPRIQEMHILIIHIICGLIEKRLYEDGFFGEE